MEVLERWSQALAEPEEPTRGDSHPKDYDIPSPHEVPVDFSSSKVPNDVDLRPSKKRKLDLVKCERCRIDKQKCLPVDREWPRKCNRCAEKDLPCSEGKRAKRMTKATQPAASNTLAEHSPPGIGSPPDRDPRIRHWSFLVSFHKLMAMAMKRLHSLKTETEKFFFADITPEFFPTYVASLPTEFYQFELFFRLLDTTVLSIADDFIAKGPVAQRGPEIFTVLLGQMLAENCFPPSDDSYCSICRYIYLSRTFDFLNDSGDSGARYLAKLGRLTSYSRSPDHWDQRHESKSIGDEWQELVDLSYAVHVKANAMLEELGRNLVQSLPRLTGQYASFLPEELTSIFESRNVLNPVQDCLGRTWLHQYLDALDSSSPDRYEIESIIEEAVEMHNLQVQDILGRSSLHIACQKGCDLVAKTLLGVGANAGAKTVADSLPLHYAAAGGFDLICKELLKTTGYNVNALDEMGHSALFYAVRNGHTIIVRRLCESDRQADPNMHGASEHPVPLIEAICGDSLEMVKHLVEAGADPYLEHNGLTAIHHAIKVDNARILGFLGSAQFLNGAIETVSLEKLLLYATKTLAVQSVEYLIHNTVVDVNAKDEKEGVTPLMHAAKNGHYSVIEKLMESDNLNIMLTDPQGKTAWALAKRGKDTSVVRLFEDYCNGIGIPET